MLDKNSTILHARIIGICFLLAFVFYGAGSYLFDSLQLENRYYGAVLIMLNAAAVVMIGILLRKTLQAYNAGISIVYLLARITEAAALSSLVLNLLPAVNFKIDMPYLIGMLALGLGSIPMCWVLFKNQLSPKWLAIWGMAGYSFFSIGFLMEFFGKQWSMYLLGLAGLWEIVFGCWLIICNGRHHKSHTASSLKSNMLIHAYSPDWVQDFKALKQALETELQGVDYTIEHVGSTAVPGLAAKPIIDIDIVYSNIADFEKIKLGLKNIGYYHAGNQGIEDRDVFKRGGKITVAVLDSKKHHLYVCKASSKALERHILSRNFLRKNNWAKQKYQQLKYELAERAGEDRKIYAALKEQHVNDFIDSIIEEEKRTAS